MTVALVFYTPHIVNTSLFQILVAYFTLFYSVLRTFQERPYRIRGSILGCVGRLDDEYFKILQNANGHEMEYDERYAAPPAVPTQDGLVIALMCLRV